MPRAAAYTATWAMTEADRGLWAAAARFHLWRQQAGGRGAHLPLTAHVRSHRLRFPVRQRGGPAPDAWRRVRFRPPADRASAAGCAILGDGSQSKSYIHVRDVDRCGPVAHQKTAKSASRFITSPPATTSPSPRSRNWPSRSAGLHPEQRVRFEYSGGDRGWKGDVPVVRSEHCPHSSARAGPASATVAAGAVRVHASRCSRTRAREGCEHAGATSRISGP